MKASISFSLPGLVSFPRGNFFQQFVLLSLWFHLYPYMATIYVNSLLHLSATRYEEFRSLALPLS